MRDLFSAAGNKAPEFNFGSFFTVTFIKQTDGWATEKGSEKTTQSRLGEKLGEKLGENRKKIIKLISKNPHISIAMMAEKVGISTTAIENNLEYLKENGHVKRIRSLKSGYWEVLE